jgi:hypothetical protein
MAHRISLFEGVDDSESARIGPLGRIPSKGPARREGRRGPHPDGAGPSVVALKKIAGSGQ